MRYSKPQIVNTVNAAATIQQVSQTDDAGKIPKGFLDSAAPQRDCSASAYESDE
jgi:hypothetical protein